MQFDDIAADNLSFTFNNVHILKSLYDRGYRFNSVHVAVDIECESDWAVYFLEHLLDILFGNSCFDNSAYLKPDEIDLQEFPMVEETEIVKDQYGRQIGYGCCQVNVQSKKIGRMVTHWRGADSPNFDTLKDLLHEMRNDRVDSYGDFPVMAVCEMSEDQLLAVVVGGKRDRRAPTPSYTV